jgi:hypothetical protein
VIWISEKSGYLKLITFANILKQKEDKFMKRVMVIIVAVLLIAGIAYAKDYEVTKKAGEYNVIVKIDKNPPVVGDNNMKIDIKDASGKNVTDAKVKVEYSMPAMPGMPPMNYKTDASLYDRSLEDCGKDNKGRQKSFHEVQH